MANIFGWNPLLTRNRCSNPPVAHLSVARAYSLRRLFDCDAVISSSAPRLAWPPRPRRSHPAEWGGTGASVYTSISESAAETSQNPSLRQSTTASSSNWIAIVGRVSITQPVQRGSWHQRQVHGTASPFVAASVKTANSSRNRTFRLMH